MMNDTRSSVVVNQIDNNDSDIHRIRASLKQEFSKFGKILKLYVEEHAKFAQVYFESIDICDRAIREFQRNQFGWKVSHPDQNHKSQNNNSTSRKSFNRTGNINSNFRKPADTLEMEEEYLEEEFSENFNYCNVHGQPLTILQADTGEFYINLRDIRKTGFALFRRDTFDSILIDRHQIHKEFELHLLSEAKNYILKNRVSCIHEEQILQTIERCKNILMKNSTEATSGQNQFSRVVQNKRPEQHSEFSDNRNKRRSDFNTRAEISPHSRPPKTLPDSFMPSNSYTSNLNQSRKNENNYKPGPSKGNSNGWDMNKNDFTKNDSRRPDLNKSNFRETSKYESNRGSFNKKDFNKEFGSKSADNFTSPGQQQRKNDQSRQRTNTLSKSEILREKLEDGKKYEVKICYCEPEKENVFWVQTIESLDICDKLLVDIADKEPSAQKISDASNGQLVLAQYEGVWFRAEVVNSRQNLLHFIDYGNQSVTDSMKIIPDKLKDIPALAIRMVINLKNTEKCNEGDELTVIIKKQYEDCTYLTDIVSKREDSTKILENGNASEKPKLSKTQQEDLREVEKPQQETINQPETSKAYVVTPEPLTTLKDGDKVMFSEQIGNRFALKTKACVDKSKEIMAYIKEMDKSTLVMTNFVERQMVLCSKEGINGLCRAIIKEVKQINVATVSYVDYPGEDVLTLKSLRNVDDYLAKQPSALLMSPEIWYLNNLNIHATNFITELVGRKQKAVIVISEKGMDFRLESNQLLSEVIEEKLPNSTKKNEPVKESTPEVHSRNQSETETSTEQQGVEKSDKKILYDDMDWIKLNPGEYEFICYHLKDAREITMVSTLDEHVKYMEDVADIPDPDNKPYKPDIYEMCLVHYTEETEGFWYRGVVLDMNGCEYIVMMVDFGNETTVPYDKIRKFPDRFKNIPILGLACDFKSLPNSSEVTTKLKELMQDDQNLKTSIKGFDDETLKYIIDIPNVREQIKEAGLC